MLLIDTYDTEAAAEKVVVLARKLAGQGIQIRGVRIDSGDLGEHARKVRAILDAGGLRSVRIVASSGLDERAIDALVRSGAPIDTFAPGTHIVTSADAPYLDCAYKLVEYAGEPRFKRSEGKVTYPGRKQVNRVLEGAGVIARDHLLLEGEAGKGTPLLEKVMEGGRRLAPSPSLATLRQRAVDGLSSLPEALRSLDAEPTVSPPLIVSSSIETILRKGSAARV